MKILGACMPPLDHVGSVPNVRFGSEADINSVTRLRLQLGQERTFRAKSGHVASDVGFRTWADIRRQARILAAKSFGGERGALR